MAKNHATVLNLRDLHDLVDESDKKVVPVGKPFENEKGQKCQNVKIIRRGFRPVDATVIAA